MSSRSASAVKKPFDGEGESPTRQLSAEAVDGINDARGGRATVSESIAGSTEPRERLGPVILKGTAPGVEGGRGGQPGGQGVDAATKLIVDRVDRRERRQGGEGLVQAGVRQTFWQGFGADP